MAKVPLDKLDVSDPFKGGGSWRGPSRKQAPEPPPENPFNDHLPSDAYMHEAPFTDGPMRPPQTEEEGSLGLGLALGLIFGMWALILALIFAKNETKKGAAIGFGIQIGLTILLVFVGAALG